MPEIQLFKESSMHVLITNHFDDDSIKKEQSLFSYYKSMGYFSGTQRQLTQL